MHFPRILVLLLWNCDGVPLFKSSELPFGPYKGLSSRATKTGPTAKHILQNACGTGKVVKGVQGPSILCLLPRFNVIDGCVPDYMHAVILGVVRQFGKLWFDTSYHHSLYYLGSSHSRNL